MAVAAGECGYVLGAPGAGKCVLLRLIANMDPGSGYVKLEGQLREHW